MSSGVGTASVNKQGVQIIIYIFTAPSNCGGKRVNKTMTPIVGASSCSGSYWSPSSFAVTAVFILLLRRVRFLWVHDAPITSGIKGQSGWGELPFPTILRNAFNFEHFNSPCMS